MPKLTKTEPPTNYKAKMPIEQLLASEAIKPIVRDLGCKASSDEDLLTAALERIKQLEEENAQLKRNQVEISTAKELYLKIFEEFPALIWRSGLDKKCDYFNKTWLEWTGRTIEQEYGNGWANSVHPDDFDACLQYYVEKFDKREYFYMEYRLLDKNGEYRWIGDHGTPFFDLDDTFLGYIGSCYDITDNKNTEEKLVKLNATKDKFFSIVAHDLRNPIATFVSLSEFLMENQGGFDADELKEIAEEMHKDSTNTLMLLENLLEWSRSQSNEIAFNPTQVEVSSLLKDVVSQVNLCAKTKEISLTDEAPVGVTLHADRHMLTTVLRNLIMNAIKFTHSGGSIRINAEVEKDSLLLTVADDGVGIPHEKIESLFNLGKNKSTAGTNDEKGSGLGLVMCKDFVERHKGRIWVESEQGKGSTFKILLPCDEI